MVNLQLPPTPSELRSIAPYLQRASELKVQEPIVAYWCAYYAAQLGISIKAKDPVSRNFLFDLLGALESMKKEIGPSDAIEDESVSSAYVENFALKVFATADTEDRKGQANKTTAKKFLAAAHFLEILSTFESSSSSEGVSSINIPEKIRYAKWKAADIAKALREGRSPAPGPAGGEDEPGEGFPSVQHPVSSDAPEIGSLDTIGSSHPSPPQSQNLPHYPEHAVGDESTADLDDRPPVQPKAWVSREVEGRNSDSEVEEDVMLRPYTSINADVHTIPFASSVPRDPGSILTHPSGHETHHNASEFPTDQHPPTAHTLPVNDVLPKFAPTSPPPATYTTPTQIPPPPPNSLQWAKIPPPISEPVPLTPNVVARAQRHCKFAISALDYEDAETARKELRAALALLG